MTIRGCVAWGCHDWAMRLQRIYALRARLSRRAHWDVAYDLQLGNNQRGAEQPPAWGSTGHSPRVARLLAEGPEQGARRTRPLVSVGCSGWLASRQEREGGVLNWALLPARRRGLTRG